MNTGLYSYAGAALAYGLFALLLLFSWRQSLQGKLLFIAMLVSTGWALVSVKIALHDEAYLLAYSLFEIARYLVWYLFLLKLFDRALIGGGHETSGYRRFVRWSLPVTVGFSVLLMLNEVAAHRFSLPGQFVLGIAGNLVLSLVGLAILEQLFRNMSANYRWATKFLFLGAGGIFAFDFYMYADAVLFHRVDTELWEIRGLVHLVSVPLFAIASARNRNWSLNIFVSRDIVLNTTVILAGGVYLLAMSVAGYYVREYAGSWGRVSQVMFIILALVFLFAVLSSSQFRARVKVFLGKHFYRNKYDYRIEWIRLTEDLGVNEGGRDRYQGAIKAMAHIVDARSGQLWLRDETGSYANTASWQGKRVHERLDENDTMIRFLAETGYVINLRELDTHRQEYGELQVPAFLREAGNAWLIVPLHDDKGLLGFMVLSDPLVVRAINWEDRDLLKTAAKQVASYLMVLTTSEQLAQSRQFEVFSRLSAYMVHDLKNIAAELDLVAINAKKHAANPEFVLDAFETVENASRDINRLLDQLRNRRVQGEKKVHLDLAEVIGEVVALKQNRRPQPQFEPPAAPCYVSVEKGRLSNVLAHLIDNAQQASQEDGEIRIRLASEGDMHCIEIRDSGHGMDEEFIRDRLFKPFDTTKGNAGMGIGMYESREFIRQQGGDIIVQSEPGKGSIITLQIPGCAAQA